MTSPMAIAQPMNTPGSAKNSSFEQQLVDDLTSPSTIEETNRIRLSRGLPPLDMSGKAIVGTPPIAPRFSLGTENPGRLPSGGATSGMGSPFDAIAHRSSSIGMQRMSDTDNDALADAQAALAACEAGVPMQQGNDSWVPTFEMRRDSRDALRHVQENCNW